MARQTLKELQNELNTKNAELNSMKQVFEDQIRDLEKKLSDTEKTKESYWAWYQNADKEIEDIHSFLNILPNAVPKVYKETPDSYEQTRKATERLMIWVIQELKK